jgi:Mn-dependent DtxR family transcriptional regulator
MLAVRRAGVTEAPQSLKRQKLIETGKNRIVVLDRKGYRAQGGAFGASEKEYWRLIG